MTLPVGVDVPAPLSVWKHFKGDRIIVLTSCRHSETKEWMVVYEHLGELWTRPLAMWHEDARPGIKRFSKA